MQIPILIEPLEGGYFRAKSGEPFAASAEASSAEAAIRALESSLNARIQSGTRIAILDLGNCTIPVRTENHFEPLPPPTPRQLEILDMIDQEIANNRRIEDEDNP